MWSIHRYTRRTDRNQTGSGMYHPIVKEQVNPGQLEGLQTNPESTEACLMCQAVIQLLFHAKSVEIFAAVDFAGGTLFADAQTNYASRNARILRVTTSKKRRLERGAVVCFEWFTLFSKICDCRLEIAGFTSIAGGNCGRFPEDSSVK
jgi:hypothetical protein